MLKVTRTVYLLRGFFCVMYHKTGVPRSGRDVVGIYGETGEGGVKIAMK